MVGWIAGAAWLVGCPRVVVFDPPRAVAGAGASIEVTVLSGVLVESSGDGLRRRTVEAPIRARMYENGRLLGVTDAGEPFFAALHDAEPRVWLPAGEHRLTLTDGIDPLVWALDPAPVRAVALDGDRLQIALPFEGVDGGPVLAWIDARVVTARVPDAGPRRHRRGIVGELQAGRSGTLVRGGVPVARVGCGTTVHSGDTVQLIRDGIRLDGQFVPDGEPCPAIEPDLRDVLGSALSSWRTPPDPVDVRVAAAQAWFQPGRVLYTIEDDRCEPWWTDGEVMAREMAPLGALTRVTIRLGNPFHTRFERHVESWTFRDGIESFSAPILLCGPPAAQLVEVDDHELRWVRVPVDRGGPLLAWPPDLVQEERVFDSRETCERALGRGLVASARSCG